MIHPARHLFDATRYPSANGSDAFAVVQAAAHDAATSPYSRKPPTPAQREANRYATGSVFLHGMTMRIETPRGTRREKLTPEGVVKWSNLMQFHYGDIVGTKGADGDPVDILIGPFPESPTVWVVNQRSQSGAFDEHKACFGFASESQAREAYLSCYERGWTGLMSITRATVTQFKWWLKFGDTSTPFTPEILPYEGNDTMEKVLWNRDAEPTTKTLAQLMYDLRLDDLTDGLLLDAVTMPELMADPDIDGRMVFDAMVVEVGRLKPKMDILMRVMEAAGGDVKPTEVSISDPVRYKGAAQVMVLFSMSDGQTVSVWLHNPDTTPTKLMPLDELISWKWSLNKKDVTIVVAPERGRDLNVREVARRLMRLVERNSVAFKKANAKTAEVAAKLESLDGEIATLETELSGLQRKIEVARVGEADRTVAADKAMRKKVEDGLQMVQRYKEVVKLLLGMGWENDGAGGASKNGAVLEVKTTKAPGSDNIIELSYVVTGNIKTAYTDPIRDDLSLTTAELATEIDAYPALPASKPELGDYVAAVIVELTDKGSISVVEAKGMTDAHPDMLSEMWQEDVPAEEAATRILAIGEKSAVAKRADAIADVLVGRYGWEKHADQDDPHGVLLTTARGHQMFIGEKSTNAKFLEVDGDFQVFFDQELMTDARIAEAMERGDWEHDNGVEDYETSTIEDESSPYFGKSAAYAYAMGALESGAVMAGMVVNVGDFSNSVSGSLLDSAAIYGITAQIGKDGVVIARADVDELGLITLLLGPAGTEEVGKEKDALGVSSVLKIAVGLLADRASAKEDVTEPELTEAQQKIADVDSAYKFDSATDAFKLAVFGSLNETAYSAFVTSRDMELAAKTHGASVAWDVSTVLDSIGDAGVTMESPDLGAILDKVDHTWHTRTMADMKKRTEAELRYIIKDATEAAELGERMGNPKSGQYRDEVHYAQMELKARKDSVKKLDAVASSPRVTFADDSPMSSRPFGDKQVAFAEWGGLSGGVMLVDLDSDDRAKFGPGVFQAGRGEMSGGQPMFKVDAKGMKVQRYEDGEWGDAKALKRLKVYNVRRFNAAYRAAAVMDSTAVLDDAEGYESIVGTISKDGAVVGRAHVGGDGKAMVYVGTSGSVRVNYKSETDGQLRPFMWSDDDAVEMVVSLLTTPQTAEAEESPADKAPPADNDLTRLSALKKLVSKDAIMSDDAQAIAKLEAKLQYLSANGEMMRKTNKLVRKGDRVGLGAMGFSGALLENLFKPDFAGRIGFADYELSNNNATLRQTRLRLEAMTAAQESVKSEESGGGSEDADANDALYEESKHVFELGMSEAQAGRIESPSENEAFKRDVMAKYPAMGNGTRLRDLGNAFRNGQAEAQKQLEAEVPAATETTDMTPAVDPAKVGDSTYLNSLINGSADMLAADVFERLEPMFEKYADDAEMTALLEQAAQAYGDAAAEQAKVALAA